MISERIRRSMKKEIVVDNSNELAFGSTNSQEQDISTSFTFKANTCYLYVYLSVSFVL